MISGDNYIQMKNNLKEYKLRIIYDPETGEIKHLSEFDEGSMGYTMEIDGVLMNIPDSMGRYIDENTDTDILGIS